MMAIGLCIASSTGTVIALSLVCFVFGPVDDDDDDETGEVRQRLVDRQPSQGEFGCGLHSESGEIGGVASATARPTAASEEFAVVRRQGLVFVQPQRPQRCTFQQQELQFPWIYSTHSRFVHFQCPVAGFDGWENSSSEMVHLSLLYISFPFLLD